MWWDRNVSGNSSKTKSYTLNKISYTWEVSLQLSITISGLVSQYNSFRGAEQWDKKG